MTSLLTNLKQVPANAGFYIAVADCRSTFYTSIGTDSAPLFSTNIYARSTVTSTLLATGGSAVFRDHGKALVSSGRVFRKVQLMVSSGQVTNGGSDGVGGIDLGPGVTPGYITGYIELPGNSSVSPNGAGFFTPVARLG
jgi:hypothetical protein